MPYLVFCYQNCSVLLWEKIVLVIEKNFWNSRLKAENLQNFEITRTIYLNSERSDQFLKQEAFLTCSWRFLGSNILEQLWSKLKKIIGIKKSAGKVTFSRLVTCAVVYSTSRLLKVKYVLFMFWCLCIYVYVLDTI